MFWECWWYNTNSKTASTSFLLCCEWMNQRVSSDLPATLLHCICTQKCFCQLKWAVALYWMARPAMQVLVFLFSLSAFALRIDKFFLLTWYSACFYAWLELATIWKTPSVLECTNFRLFKATCFAVCTSSAFLERFKVSIGHENRFFVGNNTWAQCKVTTYYFGKWEDLLEVSKLSFFP